MSPQSALVDAQLMVAKPLGSSNSTSLKEELTRMACLTFSDLLQPSLNFMKKCWINQCPKYVYVYQTVSSLDFYFLLSSKTY